MEADEEEFGCDAIIYATCGSRLRSSFLELITHRLKKATTGVLKQGSIAIFMAHIFIKESDRDL